MITRALIVRQPWIELILSGVKIWEMRSARTNIRGRVGMIEQGTGLIVGEVDLVDSIDPLTLITHQMHYDKHRIENYEKLLDWSFPWVLENAERYKKPVRYKHPQGAVIWVNLGVTK